MKQQVDKHRRDLSFQVGELVMVKLQPYKQQSLAQRLNSKLCQKYYRLFLVLQKIEQVAYELDLPSASKIHRVFHVSLLKPFSSSATFTNSVNLPVTSSELQIPKEPLAILNSRSIMMEGQLKTQCLVKWKGLPVEESSWKDLIFLQEKFPQLNLEDKFDFMGTGMIQI